VHPNGTINTKPGITDNTQMPFDLKPEMLSSYEFGTEWRFFQGRLGFDLTYYNIISTNQFIELDAPSGSGYTTYFINAGKITNKGVELTIDATPVEKRDFSWNTHLNFDKNVNKVVELWNLDPTKKIDIGSAEGYSTYLIAGGRFNDLYGYKFQRNSSGQIILDETTGNPSKISDREYLGNLDPKWSLGWNNTLSYKNFSLSFLISGKFGGKCVSQTESMLDGYGVSKRTADARDAGGVAINAIRGTTAVTEMVPETYYKFVGDRNGFLEPYVYDRTNVRLSQLAIGYDFDVKGLRLPVKALSLALVGQNLFFIYNKAPFDPDLALSTDLGSQSLDCFNVPATRTYGVNLKVTF
jgi:outer membrane receptor protein involved in Fe transport